MGGIVGLFCDHGPQSLTEDWQMGHELLPDEQEIRRAVAERTRELRLLRSIERAIARYRRETETAAEIRRSFKAMAAASSRQQEVASV